MYLVIVKVIIRFFDIVGYKRRHFNDTFDL